MKVGSRNNLYVKDKMERNDMDFAGCGVGNGYYNAREERRARLREIGFPSVLCLFFLLCLATAFVLRGWELRLQSTGNCIMADYNARNKTATFYAPNGVKCTIDARWAMLGEHTEQVALYYYGDQIWKAQVIMSVKLWICVYAFFCAALAGCIYWIYKELHQSKHATAKTGSGKFAN